MDDYGRYVRVCYYNQINCSRWANDRCYLRFSSSYNKGTCASIGGYYSEHEEDTRRGCFYNSFSACRYALNGQCYDGVYDSWSSEQCAAGNGYYTVAGSRRFCYVSYYYCSHVVAGMCYSYRSLSYDCSSCRLLSGVFSQDVCYYSDSANCSEPLLFVASNGQCYDSRSAASTPAECRAVPGEAYYDQGACYFMSGLCSPGHLVNCRCYAHRSVCHAGLTTNKLK